MWLRKTNGLQTMPCSFEVVSLSGFFFITSFFFTRPPGRVDKRRATWALDLVIDLSNVFFCCCRCSPFSLRWGSKNKKRKPVFFFFFWSWGGEGKEGGGHRRCYANYFLRRRNALWRVGGPERLVNSASVLRNGSEYGDRMPSEFPLDLGNPQQPTVNWYPSEKTLLLSAFRSNSESDLIERNLFARSHFARGYGAFPESE